MKAFKSNRAAKMAYTKAEKVWNVAVNKASSLRHEYNKDGWNEERFAAVRKLEDEAKPFFEIMREIYNQATSQGYFLPTWHFGTNATRDLIAANMD